MIFDMHVHIFPDNIAEKAAKNIGVFYGIPMCCDGKVETLLREGKQAGIDRYLVHSVATTAKQTAHINDFIASQVREHPDMFTGFMAMNQDTQDIPAEVERGLGLGLKGVKIHPDIQGVALDDERLFPLYETIEGRVPLLAHMGDKRYHFSNPSQMVKILKRYPRLTAICAHLGGYSEWDEAEKELVGTGVYVDSSSSLFALTPERAVEIMREFGTDKVLFGTDYPMWNPTEEMARFNALPLTDEERERILYKNALRLLGETK